MAKPGVLKAGEKTDVGTTAEFLAEDEPSQFVYVEAAAGNTDTIMLGDKDLQVIPLAAGQGFSLGIRNVNQAFVRALSGTQIANFLVEVP